LAGSKIVQQIQIIKNSVLWGNILQLQQKRRNDYYEEGLALTGLRFPVSGLPLFYRLDDVIAQTSYDHLPLDASPAWPGSAVPAIER
jgi:hypothetical protein